MLLRDIYEEMGMPNNLEEKTVFARRGNKVVRKYRCTTGPRKGRTVTNLGQWFAAPDVAKRNKLKITKARLGAKMARKAKRTKRTNPSSIRLRSLNK